MKVTMKQTILLTGASGAIGRETLRELVKRKDRYTIRALDLRHDRSEKVLTPFAGDAELCWGDLTEPASFEAYTEDVDVVIHLAAIIPPLADRQPELAERVNVHGTRHLIEALQQHAPHAFLFYASSVSVYGDRVRDPWIKVTDPLQPSLGDEYARTKVQAEQLITQSGLAWSIMRLTGVLSPSVSLDPLFFHMPLDTSFEIATTRDTGRAFALAVEHIAELQGRIFNLAGGEQCRIKYRDLIDRSFQITGLGRLDFPPEAFATRNFHCGYFADSDALEDILHFRQDSLEDYFEWNRQHMSLFQKALTRILRKPIKRQMLDQSEPYRALRTGDAGLIERFFGEALQTNDSDAAPPTTESDALN